MSDLELVDVRLNRIVLRDGADQQYIYLTEVDGERSFPIVIGQNEALEIHRVVHQVTTERPMTHQLALSSIEALGAHLKYVDIVSLQRNTFYARLVLQNEEGEEIAEVDARPSDGIALALRAQCGIRAAQSVIARAAADGDSSNGEKP